MSTLEATRATAPAAAPETQPSHVDVLIVGAGISGIGAAWHLRKRCPDRSFAILEMRERIGGTWDLFRYPGIRSDSDMFTLGYAFKPWKEQKSIADGDRILAYLDETVREYDLARYIRFGHKVLRADWSSATQRWTVTVEVQGETRRLTCQFFMFCGGYYDYERGYLPEFPGLSDFRGPVVHPQFWPQDLDYRGKSVVVIGSGATAVTLVPAMAETAAKVTMLQRSPTYIAARPNVDPLGEWLRRHLPAAVAYNLIRARNVLMGSWFYGLAKRKPARIKQMLIDLMKAQLPPGYDVETHFTPKYNPWDQRLCLAPDGDFFKAIREGRADIVTDHIERITPEGILLKSGRHLAADIIVPATGLHLKFAGGIAFTVDGEPVQAGGRVNYKGMMLSDVPNYAQVMGYVNASWTLKVDLTCERVCRLLNYMKRRGYTSATPRLREALPELAPLLGFSSGYVVRAMENFPRQGPKNPWRMHQSYIADVLNLRFGRLADGVLEFAAGAGRQAEPRPADAASAAAE